jgi:hypothetical protein
MAQTFENLWRQARNLFPGVPPLVVREWAQDAYERACTQHGWGFLRAEAFLTTLASRSVAVGVTQGSATVTSAGLFVASDAGRQFRIGTYPVYTIRTYTDANTVVLDRVYQADTDAAATASILSAYALMPADFGRFLVIWNPYEQRTIEFSFNQDRIARADPARSISDSGPRFVVAFKPSGETATLGQVQYEYHPYPTAARQYPYLYQRVPERLADSQVLPGLFQFNTRILRKGVEIAAAEYPGTKDLPNPYFNLGLADRLKLEWDKELQLLTLRDDEQYPEQLMQVDWARILAGGLTHNASWLRQTDAGVSDYF